MLKRLAALPWGSIALVVVIGAGGAVNAISSDFLHHPLTVGGISVAAVLSAIRLYLTVPKGAKADMAEQKARIEAMHTRLEALEKKP